MGTQKPPVIFFLENCDFYPIERQIQLEFHLSEIIPKNNYARKNLGYLVSMEKGAKIILETDDDNYPLSSFWSKRNKSSLAYLLTEKSWVNVFRYFTNYNIWPRGFALEKIKEPLPKLTKTQKVFCPIQCGLADSNPDVDAIYRFILPLPIKFDQRENIAIGKNTICPFNSQNTTWFQEVFPLLYLPSYCSFRMTDIWRSFVAQRVIWEYDWSVLFHNATVWQERNEHNLIKDFESEVSGYINNLRIMDSFLDLKLKKGIENISENMFICYEKLIDMKVIDKKEIQLLKAWFRDIKNIKLEYE